MNASIRKEVRSLAPMFVITVAATVAASLVLTGHDAVGWVNIIYCAFCLVVGASVLGKEFQSHTIGVLLAQPRRRQRVWGEKMVVLGGALLMAFAITVLAMRLFITGEGKLAYFTDELLGMAGVTILVFCSTPLMTLATRNIMGAMAGTVAMPVTLCLLVMGADLLISRICSQPKPILSSAIDRDPYPWIIGLGGIYCAVVYWLGYRKFMRLELVEGQGQELELPASVEGAVGKGLNWFLPGYSGPLASLVRKELHIQRVSFMVAAVASVLLFCEAVAWKLDKSRETEITTSLLMGTFAIFVGLIPFITGSVCMAEERNWGVVAAQFILPPSRKMQAAVKWLVTYSTCLALGVAVPILLLLAGRDWFGMRIGFLSAENQQQWIIFWHIYMAIFSLIVLGASVSRNLAWAITTSLGSMVVIGTVLGFFVNNSVMPGNVHVDEVWWIFYRIMWVIFVIASIFSFLNFQNAEMSSGRNRRQILDFPAMIRKPATWVVLAVAICGFLGWEIFREHEPRYRGKTISAWLNGYGPQGDSHEVTVQSIRDSNDAMRYFLTHNLPFLKDLAARGDVRVFEGLVYVGKAAGPMTDVLEASLTNSDWVGPFAAGALANIGPKGVSILTNALLPHGSLNDDATVRVNVASALGRYGEIFHGRRYPGMEELSDEEFSEGKAMASLVLLTLLKDSSPKVALNAAYSLARLRAHPEIVVPKLINLLHNPPDKGPQYRGNLMHWLASYGQEARAAVPDILKLIHDPDAIVGSHATNALKAIDPELAAKMGIK